MPSQEGEKSLSRAEHGPGRLSQKVCGNSVNSDPLRDREGNIIDICSIYITGTTQIQSTGTIYQQDGGLPATPPPRPFGVIPDAGGLGMASSLSSQTASRQKRNKRGGCEANRSLPSVDQADGRLAGTTSNGQANCQASRRCGRQKVGWPGKQSVGKTRRRLARQNDG